MSKFQEICAAYKDSQDSFIAYRTKSTDFAIGLGNRYIKYLGITKENFRWVPATDTSTERDGITIPGAMHLDDDTYWHLGMRIKIFSALNVFPQQSLLIIFKFKQKDKDTFEVMVDGDDKRCVIDTSSDASYTVFFDHLQKIIMGLYEDDLANFFGIAARDQDNWFYLILQSDLTEH